MWRWLKARFTSADKGPTPEELIALYDAQLLNELNRLEGPVRSAFKRLAGVALPAEVAHLHLEVFLDEPGFAFRLFGYDNDWIEVPDLPMIERFNTEVETLWPLFQDVDLSQFEIWETNRKGDKQLALRQPLDTYSPNVRLTHWFQSVTETLEPQERAALTLAFHDETRPTPLVPDPFEEK